MGNTFSQFFPPAATFTEKSVGKLEGKVYLITGANTGLGKLLAQILYSQNARVYVAARSEARAQAAIADIVKNVPESRGSLVFLQLDLEDLSTIKASAERFLAAEKKLHVLFNNAGVMTPEDKSRTPQGHERHMGINCLGHFLLAQLLTPLLVETAKAEAPGAVRVVWLASSATELIGLRNTGVDLDNLDYHKDVGDDMYKYGISKAGNYLHAVEYAHRHRADRIVSVPVNPGNLKTDLARDTTGIMKPILKLITYPPINGAYTELYAGLSPDLTLEKTGAWVVPWGRIFPIRKDLRKATEPEESGGNGASRKFWEWSEEQVKQYM